MHQAQLKLHLFALISCLFAMNAEGQSVDSMSTHQGFHVEFGIGPSFGSIESEIENGTTELEATFTGTGLAMDLHVGHSISRSLVLTGHLFTRYVYTPHIEVNGVTGLANADYTIGEIGYGAAITWYKMPSDLYAGLTLGLGGFNFKNKSEDQDFDEEGGFSWQVRAGKHWWVSNTWGVTLGATYGCTTGTLEIVDPLIDRAPFDLESSRFSILLGLGLR